MYRSKREVLSSISTTSSPIPGTDKHYTIFVAYLGSDPATGRRVRIARSDRDELKKEVSEFFKKLDSGGEDAVLLDREQARDARAAYSLIAQHELNMSLEECVRALLNGTAKFANTPCKTTVGAAWKLFMESIAMRSDAYRRCVASRVGRWVSTFGEARLLSEISAAGLKDYLVANVYRADSPGTAKTYNNVLGDIKTFVRWCCSKEQNLLAADPLDGMKKLEIGYRQPEYMKTADVERLFRVLERHKAETPAVLADAILSFFCGMRAIEIERVREGEESVRISLEHGDSFIRVIKCKGSLRGVRPRAFRIPPQAEAWMRSFDFLSAVMIPNPRMREIMKDYAKEAGVEIPKNAGRHTFITMYEAAHHDSNALSAIVGNTEGVRSRSYNGVELEREGRAYFEILPTAENGTLKAQTPSVAPEAR